MSVVSKNLINFCSLASFLFCSIAYVMIARKYVSIESNIMIQTDVHATDKWGNLRLQKYDRCERRMAKKMEKVGKNC